MADTTEDIDPRVLEIARKVLREDKEFREAFPDRHKHVMSMWNRIVDLEIALQAMTSERDAMREQLLKIGRKAFWAGH